MITLRAERWINASPNAVFERLTDHERYREFPPIDDSKLLEAGESEPNGLGALRLIVARPFRLKERITRFNRPHEFHYQIIDSSPVTIRHEIGWLKFEEKRGGCQVDWESRFAMEIPLIGGLLERMLASRFQAGFYGVLKAVARELEPRADV